MKPITILGSAPPGLTQYLAPYHANQSWTDFRDQVGSSYNELRRALVDSQHWLCGYCETLLVDDDTQIEHVIPTSASADAHDYDLDYTNVIACCKGGTAGNYFGPDTRQHDPDRVGGTSCGQAKGDTNDQLFLDPRNLPILRSLFRVQSNGNIDADEDACKSAGTPAYRVKRTIEILGLNSARLKKARSDRWDYVNSIYQDYFEDTEVMTQAARLELLPNVNGILSRFFTTSRSYFKPFGSDAIVAEGMVAWV